MKLYGKISFIGLALVALLGLQGCYVSDVRVLESGEQVPVAGISACEGGFLVKTTIFNFKEEASGIPLFRSYRYYDKKEGIYYTFRKIKDDLYLAQLEQPESKAKKDGFKYVYVYFLFSTEKDFTAMVPNIMYLAPHLEAMWRRHNLTEVKSSSDMIKLAGNAKDLEKFFTNHDIGFLMSVFSCTRRGE